MKNIVLFSLLFILYSCQNKEILLPKAAETIVAHVDNHSPVYLFFKQVEKDTMVDVNRNNAISSTNWLFNIDKRLPLKLVIKEIEKLQSKKSNSVHKNELSENYYTYTDSVKKSLAFFSFTKVKYKLEVPDKSKSFIYFKKNGLVKFNELIFSKEQLPNFLNELKVTHTRKIVFSYDKNLSFGEYIGYELFVRELVAKDDLRVNHNLVYIY